jgi:hypothetical protein
MITVLPAFARRRAMAEPSLPVPPITATVPSAVVAIVSAAFNAGVIVSSSWFLRPVKD